MPTRGTDGRREEYCFDRCFVFRYNVAFIVQAVYSVTVRLLSRPCARTLCFFIDHLLSAPADCPAPFDRVHVRPDNHSVLFPAASVDSSAIDHRRRVSQYACDCVEEICAASGRRKQGVYRRSVLLIMFLLSAFPGGTCYLPLLGPAQLFVVKVTANLVEIFLLSSVAQSTNLLRTDASPNLPHISSFDPSEILRLFCLPEQGSGKDLASAADEGEISHTFNSPSKSSEYGAGARRALRTLLASFLRCTSRLSKRFIAFLTACVVQGHTMEYLFAKQPFLRVSGPLQPSPPSLSVAFAVKKRDACYPATVRVGVAARSIRSTFDSH